MKIIIYFGNLGSTEKAALLLKSKLVDCDIQDGTKIKKIDFSQYDEVIFGTNVRMNKFNKKFNKYYKKFVKLNYEGIVDLFIVAGGADKSGYFKSATQMIPNVGKLAFFGGEFDTTNAKGLSKVILESCIKDFKSKGLDLPKLDLNAIDAFAQEINNY